MLKLDNLANRVKLQGANIGTNTPDARKASASISISLEDNEQIVSLHIKKLYTNVPVGEAIKLLFENSIQAT